MFCLAELKKKLRNKNKFQNTKEFVADVQKTDLANMKHARAAGI
jgi:hypothetical protein